MIMVLYEMRKDVYSMRETCSGIMRLFHGVVGAKAKSSL